ncbi:MAG: Glu-tRNA(Gln) amidotransferase subunit GatD, partial [Thermoplasmatota archaeon]
MREELLEGIEEGDYIKIIEEDKEYIGILMPRHRFSGKDIITLKLDNGYNIGIKADHKTKVELIEKKEKIENGLKETINMNKDLPEITILGTGGTIASYVEYRTGAVHPAQSAEDMLYSNPEIANRCYPKVDILFSKLSEDLTPEDWVNIADRISVELNNGSEGVVIAHGTDTIGYTAAALSFLLEGLSKPVVLVGSQRSSDRPSSDAYLNLLGAVEVAKSELTGVYVVMHDTISDDRCSIHKGTKIRKMHTSRRDAFQSINTEPIGYVDPKSGKVDVGNCKIFNNRGSVCRRGRMESDVSLIYAYPGLKEKELK